MSAERTGSGRLLKYHSNYYYVEADGILYECSVKGILKKEGQDLLVGDEVSLDNVDSDARTARISGILPRKSLLGRPKIANIDRVLIVHPLKQPDFSAHQLDRYLTHVEVSGLVPLICISKCDLKDQEGEEEAVLSLYREQLGYTVFLTSILKPETCQPILSAIGGKVSVVAGLSGAGKSSLLNTLNPDLGLRVQDVSLKLGRGQHTTRHVELLEIAPHTYMADTPGFSNLKFTDVSPQTIRATFPEFRNLETACEFNDCLHLDEAGCAIPNLPGVICESRYQSYRELVEEAKQHLVTLQTTSQKSEYGTKTLHQKGKKDLQILKLKEKAREASRRTDKQRLQNQWDGSPTGGWDGEEPED